MITILALFIGACIGAISVAIVYRRREAWEPWVTWHDMTRSDDAGRD